jgi:hypothetical protein
MGSSITRDEILNQLAAFLSGTTLKASRERNALVVRYEHYSTHVELTTPDERNSPMGPIEAVVQIRTDLPDEMAHMIAHNPKRGQLMNRMASCGALTFDGQQIFVGSRLTILQSDNAWNIQAPMVVCAIIGAAEAILGGTRRALSGQTGGAGTSAWGTTDFEQVEERFSGRCVCFADEAGFSAEFPLRAEAISAAAGDSGTALWKIATDEPHPVAGGGIFCALELPHRLSDAARLSQVLAQLNQLEMQPQALPPHFGAWCPGTLEHNPAYISFLPNALHEMAPGIAVNMTGWAWARAQWANITLASMGLSAKPSQRQGRLSKMLGFLQK